MHSGTATGELWRDRCRPGGASRPQESHIEADSQPVLRLQQRDNTTFGRLEMSRSHRQRRICFPRISHIGWWTADIETMKENGLRLLHPSDADVSGNEPIERQDAAHIDLEISGQHVFAQ